MKQFIEEGYATIARLAPAVVREAHDFVKSQIRAGDLHSQASAIMDALAATPLFAAIQRSVLPEMKAVLGPDVCVLNYDALWINAPRDKNPVLLKGIHNDAWTGTGVYTVFCKFFLTDCDRYNGVTVYPKSHLQGMLPVRNRKLAVKAKWPAKNIIARAGDILIWHPLLLHSTTGHSATNTRISITSRYTSTETPFTSQERALGYRTLSVGPMNHVLRYVGNDYLTPMRTYGGEVAIDKRLAHLYGR